MNSWIKVVEESCGDMLINTRYIKTVMPTSDGSLAIELEQPVSHDDPGCDVDLRVDLVDLDSFAEALDKANRTGLVDLTTAQRNEALRVESEAKREATLAAQTSGLDGMFPHGLPTE